MPLISLSSQEAQGNFRHNRASLWPIDPRHQSRLQGVATVGFQPSFQLEAGEAIFTVGSCFARNIEARLAALGFELPTLGVTLEVAERSSTGAGFANSFLNKYTPLAILNEFRWGLDPDAAYPDEAYVAAGEDLWSDPQAAPQTTPASWERIRERRAETTALYRQLARCRIVILTLGLVESWFDTRTGLHLNGPPPQFALKSEPDRFQLHLLSVEEIGQALEGVHGLLSRFGHADFRMLVTVSPVPLNATFRGGDVIAANTYSKSALRAAAEAFVLAHAEVDYLPSYEIVTHTERRLAFGDDCRHVTAPVVARIVDRMVEHYVPGAGSAGAGAAEAAAPGETRGRVAICVRKRDFDKAAKILGRLREGGWEADGYGEFDFRLEYGRVLMQAGRHLEAQPELTRAVELEPDSVIALLGLSKVNRRLDRRREAEACLARAAELRPDDANIRCQLAGEMMRDERHVQALAQIKACLTLDPAHARGRELRAECEQRLGGEWLAPDEDDAPPVAPTLQPERHGLSGLVGRLVRRPKSPA